MKTPLNKHFIMGTFYNKASDAMKNKKDHQEVMEINLGFMLVNKTALQKIHEKNTARHQS